MRTRTTKAGGGELARTNTSDGKSPNHRLRAVSGSGALPPKGALHEPRMHGKTYCPTRPASVILLSERGGRSSRELALPFRPLGHTSRPDAARVKVLPPLLHANKHTASCTTCIDPSPRLAAQAAPRYSRSRCVKEGPTSPPACSSPPPPLPHCLKLSGHGSSGHECGHAHCGC